MSRKNKLMRSQKGSISMFVIVSVLFFTFILVGMYASYVNKLKSQEEQLWKIKDNYGKFASHNEMDNLYIIKTQQGNDGQNNLTEAEKAALTTNGIAALTSTEIASLPNATYLTNNSNIKAILTGGVVIPIGFTYVEGKKDTGVVVSVRGVDDVISEFVWVPVDEISEMAQLQEGSTQNYQGKLYRAWTTTGSTHMSNYGVGTTSYREPSLVTDNEADLSAVLQSVTGTTHDADASLYAEDGIFYEYFADVEEFGQAMQDDYNDMIESVIKYKGFYIGRYETSTNGETVASTTGTENTRPMANLKWYNMYKLQREFSNSSVILSAVKSSMAWGSQIDAMFRWVIETQTDAAKIVATTNAPHNNSVTEAYRPGSQASDEMNNIYDLEGNVREWNLEAQDTIFRVLRGGGYSTDLRSPIYRGYDVPIYGNASWGSRCTLHIL